MPWWAWMIVANIAVAITERIYRTGAFDTFWQGLPCLAIPILVAQAGLFYGFRGASSLFVAGVFFTIVNVAFRVVNSYTIGEALNWYGWAGVGCLVASAVLFRIR